MCEEIFKKTVDKYKKHWISHQLLIKSLNCMIMLLIFCSSFLKSSVVSKMSTFLLSWFLNQF